MTIEELFNILMSDNPQKLLIQNEVELFQLIPELETCKGFKQNNDWHIYDVYEHILNVVDNIKPNIALRLAALFHDVGKPLTYKEDENGLGHFFGHWEQSQTIFNQFAIKHNLPVALKDLVSLLIYYHDMNLAKLDDDSINKLFELLGNGGIELLYELKRADLLAQNEKYHYILDDYVNQKNSILLKKRNL